MWIAIALVSGLASLAGYGLFQDSSPDVVAFVLTFAAGAILTMLANTMMPEAFEHGGKLGRGRDDAGVRGRVLDPRAGLSARCDSLHSYDDGTVPRGASCSHDRSLGSGRPCPA